MEKTLRPGKKHGRWVATSESSDCSGREMNDCNLFKAAKESEVKSDFHMV